jgi:hypothetical protein
MRNGVPDPLNVQLNQDEKEELWEDKDDIGGRIFC